MSDRDTCKITYYVQGMHCAACETLIEKTIEERSEIKNVRANLKNQTVEITAENKNQIPQIQKLNNNFKDLGYSFHEKRIQDKKFSPEEVIKIILTIVIIVGTFIFTGRAGLFRMANISASSSFFSFFIFGLAVGLSSCAALVGGLLLSLSNQWNQIYGENTKKSAIPFMLFNLGRLLSFALLGGLLGLVGSYLRLSLNFTIILTLAVSVVMMILGFQMLGVRWAKSIKLTTPKFVSKYITDETNFKGKYIPFVVGGLTFFVPCGFTLIAQTNALSSGNILTSAAIMFSFALGTLPILAIISYTSVKMLTSPNFSRIFNIVAGTLIIFFALYSINSQLNVLGLPSFSDITTKNSNVVGGVPENESAFVGNVQYMQMEATEFEYYPKEIYLKAGIPVKWEFYNGGAQGCARAVSARGLYPGTLVLKPGMNETEVTPQNKGTYKITCTMGMVPPVTVYVY